MIVEKKFFFKLYTADNRLDRDWYVIYYLDGKRKRKSGRINRHDTYHGRRKAARLLIDELAEQYTEDQLTKLADVQYKRRKVKDRIYQYIADHQHLWRESTYQSYKNKADIFFTWLGNDPITKKNINAFFLNLQKQRHTTTYNTYVTAIKYLFKGIGKEKIVAHINRVKTTKTPARYYQKHQVARLKRHIEPRDPELWLHIKFIYYCGLRPKEARHVRAGDIILEENKILVKNIWAKNGKTRYAKIPDVFVEDLDFIIDMYPDEYIFPNRKDRTKPIGRNTLTNRHKKMLRELRFDTNEYKMYSWRHTGAIRAIKAGITPKELQIHFDHHSLDQTNQYLRQMGFNDLENLQANFPGI